MIRISGEQAFGILRSLRITDVRKTEISESSSEPEDEEPVDQGNEQAEGQEPQPGSSAQVSQPGSSTQGPQSGSSGLDPQVVVRQEPQSPSSQAAQEPPASENPDAQPASSRGRRKQTSRKPSKRSSKKEAKKPKDVESEVNFMYVSSYAPGWPGDGQIIIVTHDDQVYGTGGNNLGLLGVGNTDPVELRTIKIQELCGKHVVDIKSGDAHLLALTADGKVYTWGKNKYGEIGNGSTNTQLIPRTVRFPDPQVFILKIFAGWKLSFAFGYNQDARFVLYFWGKKCRTADHVAQPMTWRNPVGIAGQIVDVQCNPGTVFIRTRDGRLYSFGWNHKGQAGVNSQDATVQDPIEIDLGGTVAKFCVAKLIAGALTSNGDVYIWGGFNEPVRGPAQVELGQAQVKDMVACGQDIAVIWADSGVTMYREGAVPRLNLQVGRQALSSALRQIITSQHRRIKLMVEAWRDQSVPDNRKIFNPHSRSKIRQTSNADVEFTFPNERRKKTIFAHSTILKESKSSFYEIRLSERWNPDNTGLNRIPVTDYSYPAFLEAIHYLYVGELRQENLDIPQLIELINLARLHFLDWLKFRCVRAISLRLEAMPLNQADQIYNQHCVLRYGPNIAVADPDLFVIQQELLVRALEEGEPEQAHLEVLFAQ